MERSKVIIIGAGPAGIAAALRLVQTHGCSVTILERGLDLPDRVAARQQRAEARGGASVNLEGFGGAGAFSDGKLTLTPQVGGHLAQLLGDERAGQLISQSDEMWLRFGAPEKLYGADEDVFARLAHRATRYGLKLVSVPLRHVGTDNCPAVLGAMRDSLATACEIRPMTPVEQILTHEGAVTGVGLSDGTILPADFVVAAPGRSGQPWFHEQARKLELQAQNSPVDLGVRVEVPAPILDELTEQLYEFKLLYWSPTFDNLVRTFCVCPGGEVVTERLGDVVTVNGHSYANRKTDNTNFAILVSSTFTEPFREPVLYGEYIARLANLLGDGVLVQRLVDLKAGRRSTTHRLEHCILSPTLKTAAPGDLSYVLPYRHLQTILEMIAAIDQLAPGAGGSATLLYGVEVKLYSARVSVTDELETSVKNLFACGDGAGITRGLVQASASGLAAGQAIAARIQEGV